MSDSKFKQEWEAKKLLKRVKKQTKKKLLSQGLNEKQAKKAINIALKRISEGKDGSQE